MLSSVYRKFKVIIGVVLGNFILEYILVFEVN